MNGVYEIITAQVIERLEAGVIPWERPWDGDEMPQNFLTRRPYSGVNILLTSITAQLKGFELPWWLTFKQAKKRGGFIRKGERGTTVVFVKRDVVVDVDEDGEESVRSRRVLRYYRVWNVEQTQGVEIPKLERPEHDIRPIDRCVAIVEGMPQRPRIVESTIGSARYTPGTDTVEMPRFHAFHSSESYYSALYHELVHSTGHESRLDRCKAGGFGAVPYSKEELVAELGASFLCATASIDKKIIDNSAAYIESWLTVFRKDKRVLISAASLASKAADYIRGRTESAAQSAAA